MTVINYFDKVIRTLDFVDHESIRKVSLLIGRCKGTIFTFGNGGSASTASHFAQDMSKTLDKRFVCLNDSVPCLTAYANDNGYESVFKLQLSKLIAPGDLVIGISCSGNSRNIIDAIIFAKHYGYMTIGLTGFDGGQLMPLVEHSIHVPCSDMQVCEDIHLIITHTILKLLS